MKLKKLKDKETEEHALGISRPGPTWIGRDVGTWRPVRAAAPPRPNFSARQVGHSSGKKESLGKKKPIRVW